jgi:succinate-semialdehyde dehydrogenase/glutarate-semialdehyde dehydrogenase
MKSINPYTNKVIQEYEPHSQDHVTKAIEKAEVAFQKWRTVPTDERATHLMKLHDKLLASKETYAKLITEEMGKPLAQSIGEVEKCAWLCEYYSETAPQALEDEVVKTDGQESFVTYHPLGIILGVMPWNFPFWQVFRFAIPTIAAGNTCLLKHASNVSGCALAIEKIFNAGLPKHVFQTLLISSDAVPDIIAHQFVQGVSVTGSVVTGRSVAEVAGHHLKKTVLELGGSDPYIILKDADIAKSAKICAQGRLQNAGQSCIAAKRFIVEKSVYDDFLKALEKEMSEYKIGNPMKKTTKLGPMSSIGQRNDLHMQVQKSIVKGAKCLIGGELPQGDGAFYPPTILTDITPDMPAYCEELFGPVAIVLKATNKKDAFRIANDTNFGLGSAIFTQNTQKAKEYAKEKINAGSCFINDFVKSDPRLPFGGIKESGYGRELSHFGIREFTNIKTIVVND